MPLPGEVGLVPTLLEHGTERPFRFGQATALSLKGDGRHAATIGEAPGDHRRASWRAARLRVEGEERHPGSGHLVEVRRWHAAARTAAVRSEIAVAGVVGDDEEDVGFVGRPTRTNRLQ